MGSLRELAGKLWKSDRPVARTTRLWAPYLFAVLILFLDPILHAFGTIDFVGGKENAVDRAVGTALSPFYGGRGRPGQQDIVIVELDDAFREQAGGSWPPAYATTNALLQKVLADQPRAVFLDTYFQDPHTPGFWPDQDGARRLAATLTQHQPGGGVAPVFIGPVLSKTFPLSLLAVNTANQVGIDRSDEGDFGYPTRDNANRPMAAVALYQAWLGHAPPPLPKDLALDWGFGGSPWTAARRQDLPFCFADSEAARWSRFGALLWRLAAPNLKSREAATPGHDVQCHYFDSVSAVELGDKVVDDHLRGRIVLIGSTMTSLADRAATPLQSSVPGVTVHAMALDNLIQNGASVTHYPAQHDWWLRIDNYDLLQFGLLTAGFIMIGVWRFAARTPAEEDLPSRARLTVWLAVLFVALLVALLCHWPLSKAVFMVLVGGACSEAWAKIVEHQRERQSHPSSIPSASGKEEHETVVVIDRVVRVVDEPGSSPELQDDSAPSD